MLFLISELIILSRGLEIGVELEKKFKNYSSKNKFIKGLPLLAKPSHKKRNKCTRIDC